MIARIKGILLSKSPSFLIVDVHDIGYQVFVPLSSYYPLPDEGTTISLFIHTHVREDALTLFGFLAVDEKQMFELLISVSSIGPKLALNILSGITVDKLVSAILHHDIDALVSIPGIGKKTAERMVLELKDKVEKSFVLNDEKPFLSGELMHDALLSDVESALFNLGYSKDAAKKTLRKVSEAQGGELSFEELIKLSLQELSNG